MLYCWHWYVFIIYLFDLIWFLFFFWVFKGVNFKSGSLNKKELSNGCSEKSYNLWPKSLVDFPLWCTTFSTMWSYIYILRNKSYVLKTILKGGKILLQWKHSDNSSNKSKENKEQLQTRKGILLRWSLCYTHTTNSINGRTTFLITFS